jgi:hypothetical protein
MIYQSRLDQSVVDINIDSDKTYGLMLSGGLDSAVLLYLLVRSVPEIKIQPFTIPKTDGAMLYVNGIIDHFNKKFNLKIPYTIEVGDPTVYHREQSKTAIVDIFKNHQADIIFIALNQNPIELNSLPGAPQRTRQSDNPRIVLPFVNLLKHHILDFVYEYNQEDLIDITHSCTEQAVGRCEVCWQCTERKWAFSKLAQTDTGTR